MLCRNTTTALIQGETGTGKELIARVIHKNCMNSDAPFITVDCSAMVETLLESELFGHEKGAFTGAIARTIGKFELAQRGTLLLDEISEMNSVLQAKILRVVQDIEVDRSGGSRPIPIDIRVIATTNRDLEAWVEKGQFREDLYYRLQVIKIALPPLRERPGDIELLTNHFLKKFAGENKRPFRPLSGEAMAWLKSQEWRGNVRELKNVLERAVLLSSQSTLDLADFSAAPGSGREAEGEGTDFSSLCLRDMEERLISRALEKTQGNRTHAARMLGISIRTLRNKLNEYKRNLPAEGLS